MLDSDAYFIRDFGREDFFTATGEPRFVLSRFPTRFAEENDELLALLRGQETPPPLDLSALLPSPVDPQDMGTISRWRLRLDRLTSQRVRPRRVWIQNLLCRPGLAVEFMPSPLWTEAVLRDMWERFLVPRKLDYFDIIKFSPWENHWYGEWLLATQCAPIHPTLPYFLHFSSDEDILRARAEGFTVEDFAVHFLGIQLAAGHQQIECY